MDKLEEALWPEGRPPSAWKSLQVHIVRLRRALGSRSIVERHGGYQLDADLVAVDAARVAELLAEAREAISSGEPDQAAGLLAEAKAAFRGEPFEGVADTAVPVGEVQRLQQLQVAVVEEGFQADLAGGRGERCIAAFEAFVQVNPYRERAWGQLMRALYQAGRPADSLAAYGRARSCSPPSWVSIRVRRFAMSSRRSSPRSAPARLRRLPHHVARRGRPDHRPKGPRHPPTRY